MNGGIFDRLDTLIVDRTKLVIAIFLLATILMSLGIVQISSNSGTAQFTENIPSAEALEKINEEFSSRSVDGGSSGSQTQLIHERTNVLSKNSLLEMLELQQELKQRSAFRISEITSVANQVALRINPSADTVEDKISTIESSTNGEISRAVSNVLKIDQTRSIVSDDYNSNSVTASKTITTVTHKQRASSSGGPAAGVQDDTSIADVQLSMSEFVSSSDYRVTVFGNGIQSEELGSVTFDSLTLVVPAAIISILVFLIIAYRDPFDIVIGLISILFVVVWTFGFMGWANLPFTQVLVSVPPLLLAVGIDFGIHSVNRFREEMDENTKREKAVQMANRQLFVSFALVAGSTAIGFGSNISSPLGQIQDFGIIASIGIVFTSLIFGIFTPSLKLQVDRYRDNIDKIPEFGTKPLGSEDSSLGRILSSVTEYNIKYPAVGIFIVLILSIGVGYYATGVESEFSQDTFLPPEETPTYVEILPLDIGDYDSPKILSLIDENFERFGESTLIVYIPDNIRADSSLEKIEKMLEDPPDVVIQDNDRASASSLISVIKNGRFSDENREIIESNDIDGDGVPDQNLDKVYNSLDDNPRSSAYLTESRGSTRIIYSIEGDASTDEIISAGRKISEETRFTAIPTGGPILLNEVSEFIIDSTTRSLVISILLTIVFLGICYKYLEGRPVIGFINVMPVLFAVIMLLGTMRYLGVSLNPITATTIGTAVGIGLDYAIHLTHRITDELDERETVDEAILISVRGTGGALLGSALTTVTGIGSLILAITPVLADFGLIIALSIFYSFVFSMTLIPAAFKIIGR